MYFTFKWSATIIISWVVLVKAEPYIKKGKCGISGKCGSEAICVQFQPNWYICMCPQENSDPTKDLKCLTWPGLKISPDLPEYTLTSNSTEDDRVFTCKGNEPVQWYFEQYDGSLLEKNNKLIKNILTKDKNNYTYSASFSLARPTYLDTGYYYCAPLSAEEKLIKLFKKIYIFIKQEPYLFAFPDDYNKIKFNDINGIQSTIIPCRPTSPDIKIELFQNEDWVKNVSDSFYYNEKIGLILLNDGRYENKIFTCIAMKNSITRQQQFIYDSTNKPKVESINSSKSGVLYCNIGKICKFEFLVSGYSLLLAKWTYTNCTIDTSTECVTDIPITVKNISLTPVTQKYIITLFFIENGTLICNVSNTFGKSIEEYSVIFHSAENSNAILIFLLILLAVTVFNNVLWLITKRVPKQKIAEYCKAEFEMGKAERWNPNLGYKEQAHLLPYDTKWEFSLDKIKLDWFIFGDRMFILNVMVIAICKQIGSGAFGIVYKAKAIGIIHDDTTSIVAVKTVKTSADASHTMALASELKIMTHIGRHLNIVNLLGACTTSISKKLMVIVEFCCFGSIDRYMQQHKNGFINQITPDGLIENIETESKILSYENVPFKPSNSEIFTSSLITSDGHSDANVVELGTSDSPHGTHKHVNTKPLCTNDLLSWSYQVSKGMDYLASRKILHGDLASRNILLADGNVVKICDFGLAKNMFESNFYRNSKKGVLPIKWLAIESIRYGIYSTASDVWSFGVVLWEIFSLAAIPYPNIELNDLLDLLIQGYRMEQPAYSNSKIYGIMLDCWRKKPTKRPSFSDLAKRIGDWLLESTKAEYAELNDHHMKMYENLPSSDKLGLLAAPTRSNNSVIVNDAVQNTNTRRHNSDIEMKTMIVHNQCYSL